MSGLRHSFADVGIDCAEYRIAGVRCGLNLVERSPRKSLQTLAFPAWTVLKRGVGHNFAVSPETTPSSVSAEYIHDPEKRSEKVRPLLSG